MVRVLKWNSCVGFTVEPLYSGHPDILSLIEGWPYLRGRFVLKECIWDSVKWPL